MTGTTYSPATQAAPAHLQVKVLDDNLKDFKASRCMGRKLRLSDCCLASHYNYPGYYSCCCCDYDDG